MPWSKSAQCLTVVKVALKTDDELLDTSGRQNDEDAKRLAAVGFGNQNMTDSIPRRVRQSMWLESLDTSSSRQNLPSIYLAIRFMCFIPVQQALDLTHYCIILGIWLIMLPCSNVQSLFAGMLGRATQLRHSKQSIPLELKSVASSPGNVLDFRPAESVGIVHLVKCFHRGFVNATLFWQGYLQSSGKHLVLLLLGQAMPKSIYDFVCNLHLPTLRLFIQGLMTTSLLRSGLFVLRNGPAD